MKKYYILFLGLVFFIFSNSNVFALSFTEMGKGEDSLNEAFNLFDRGQYDAASSRIATAIKHFENVLADDSSHKDVAKAQEGLGYCFWMLHKEERAQVNFMRAKANFNAKQRILKFLAEKYNKALEKELFSRSFTINRYAINIDPSLKSEPIAVYTLTAKKWLQKGRPDIAEMYLNEVIYMDRSKKDEAAMLFYEAGYCLTEPIDKIKLYRIALI